jgi:hypothetical protein
MGTCENVEFKPIISTGSLNHFVYRLHTNSVIWSNLFGSMLRMFYTVCMSAFQAYLRLLDYCDTLSHATLIYECAQPLRM